MGKDKVRWYHLAIIGIFIGVFGAISYFIFGITPKEYYWIAAIVDSAIMIIGIMILSKIPLPEDAKDL